MPRYEFSEGSSNKFWEIELDGSAFVTRYGKIGTPGQETRKDWPSAEKAKVEYDKIIAEKVKKGYQLVGGGGGGGGAKKAAPPAKAAAAPAKAPAPAKAAAGGASAALRYELSEGGSNKFWEITLDGNRFLTRYGKIGADGQTTVKDFGDAAEAKIQYEKIIAEKEKKGYQLVSGSRPAAPKAASNPELERAILDAPDDERNYAIYADWLQAEGDPRGELIALALAGKKKEADKLLAAHADFFLPGPGKKKRKSSDEDDDDGEGGGDLWEMLRKGYTWHNGFIRSLKIKPTYDDYESGVDQDAIIEALGAVLAHPSGRFLREVTLGLLDFESDNDYTGFLKFVDKARPPLTSLFLGDFEYPDDTEMSWAGIGDLSKLWGAAPRLEKLILQGGGELKLGAIKAPSLKHFELRTGGLPRKQLQAITAADWPNLETLIVWCGSSSYGWDGKIDDLKPILDGGKLPKLKHLAIMNAEITDALAARLPDAKIVKQLETLDLSMGTLSDEGAAALAAGAAKLKHLKTINLDDNIVATKKILARFGAAVKLGKQRAIEDWWEDRRYVSVGE